MKQNENIPKIWKEEYKTTGSDTDFYVRLINYEKDISLIICDKYGEKIKEGAHILSLDFYYNIIILDKHVNKNFPLKTNFEGYSLIEDVDTIHDHSKKIHIMSHFIEQIENINKEVDSTISKH